MRTKNVLGVLAAAMVGVLVMGGQARAGFEVYVELTANGSAVEGETTRLQIAGTDVEGHLECVAVEHEIYRPDAGGTRPSGNVVATAYKLVKRVDKASPLLLKALTNGETITATLRFFRKSTEDASTEHYFTVELENARIAGVRSWQPSSLDEAGSVLPFMEEIQIVSESILWTDEITGKEHLYNARSGGA